MSIIIAYFIAWTLSLNPQITEIRVPIHDDQHCWIDLTDQTPSQCEYEPTQSDRQFVSNILYFLGTFNGYDYLAVGVDFDTDIIDL